jgi:hypothetical protein
MNVTITQSRYRASFVERFKDLDVRVATADELKKLREIQAECERLRDVISHFSDSQVRKRQQELASSLVEDPSTVTTESIDNLKARTIALAADMERKRHVAKLAYKNYWRTTAAPACETILKRAVVEMRKLQDLVSENMKGLYASYGIPHEETELEAAIRCTIAAAEQSIEALARGGGARSPRSTFHGLGLIEL